jgi:hypothetical protein
MKPRRIAIGNGSTPKVVEATPVETKTAKAA